ncbi:hypothetical protein MNEG_11521 [Monoraphidium neglectum]|uniref:Uncharacterized protein n=1 Tax=Monoraphidium neglectum TaxID=145388 RepID=A0A0D2MP04_9CHLO|nr:hypothetical protein MNEG_11521 [Monoraphidium neglectum]KIY96440.1 hypothetical protein MNEG_11521 [Monoraphidium neglectum]|eukprot:XP_013895460.1 hypothetical protein MNEG_11521 [Monoraphidium neglectum]
MLGPADGVALTPGAAADAAHVLGGPELDAACSFLRQVVGESRAEFRAYDAARRAERLARPADGGSSGAAAAADAAAAVCTDSNATDAAAGEAGESLQGLVRGLLRPLVCERLEPVAALAQEQILHQLAALDREAAARASDPPAWGAALMRKSFAAQLIERGFLDDLLKDARLQELAAYVCTHSGDRLPPRPRLRPALTTRPPPPAQPVGVPRGTGDRARGGCSSGQAGEAEDEEAAGQQPLQQGERHTSAFGAGFPVPFDSPFVLRRLLWGLLGRLAPRVRERLARGAGMCPHSSSTPLWSCVSNSLIWAISWGPGGRGLALAAAAGVEVGAAAREEAEAAYARALDATFEQAYSPSRVALACRIIEALGPQEFALTPAPETVVLWPAMARQAMSLALLQCVGPEGWAHLPGAVPGASRSTCAARAADEGEGAPPMWAVWFHMRMLGACGQGGGGPARARRGAVAAELARRLAQPGAGGAAREAAVAAAVRRLYDDPDLR